MLIHFNDTSNQSIALSKILMVKPESGVERLGSTADKPAKLYYFTRLTIDLPIETFTSNPSDRREIILHYTSAEDRDVDIRMLRAASSMMCVIDTANWTTQEAS